MKRKDSSTKRRDAYTRCKAVADVFFAILIRIEFFEFRCSFLGEFDHMFRKLSHLSNMNSKLVDDHLRWTVEHSPKALIAYTGFEFVEKNKLIVDGQRIDMKVLNDIFVFMFDRS